MKIQYLFCLFLFLNFKDTIRIENSSNNIIMDSIDSKANKPKMVFAHYMVCNKTYQKGSVEGYIRDITDAKEMGIDGFALNLGAWNKNYKVSVERIFEAASQVDTSFKLFFSPDRCCGLNANDVKDMFIQYVKHPNYYYYNNKPFLSGWTGPKSGNWWMEKILTPLKDSGQEPYLVPFLYTLDVDETPDYSKFEASYEQSWNMFMDGYFYFGAAGLPKQIVKSGEAAAEVLHSNNKSFMATVSPYYWGCKQKKSGRRYFEFNGGEGLHTQWMSIINNQNPEWVELVTWNDWDEGTYFSPMDDIVKHWPWTGHRYEGFYKTHKGFAALNKFYIEWYKSGQIPEITKDAIFVFYRTHPKDLIIEEPKFGHVRAKKGDLKDEIYITAILKKTGTLKINTGSRNESIKAEAGIHHYRIPFEVGNQKIILKRGIKTIMSLEGEDIVNETLDYNFNLYSNYLIK